MRSHIAITNATFMIIITNEHDARETKYSYVQTYNNLLNNCLALNMFGWVWGIRYNCQLISQCTQNIDWNVKHIVQALYAVFTFYLRNLPFHSVHHCILAQIFCIWLHWSVDVARCEATLFDYFLFILMRIFAASIWTIVMTTIEGSVFANWVA